jgi:hypothetical protein
MDMESKCSLIEEFMREYRLNDQYEEYDVEKFLEYNDIGIPLAQSVSYGLATPTIEGKDLIEETWVLFCEMLGADFEDEFDDLDDLLDSLGDDED